MADLNQTPKGNRIHIGIFGKRNAGKSSFINTLTKQKTALVSDVAGTTTDPVYKAMEILPLGPVMLIDTAGIDDVGELGKLRIEKTKEVMAKTDIAIILTVSGQPLSEYEERLIKGFRDLGTQFIFAINKIDEKRSSVDTLEELESRLGQKVFSISAKTGEGFDELREEITKLAPKAFEEAPLLRDLVEEGETVLFCVPIDTAAPKGRLILPQVQALRDTLDAGAIGIIAKENQIKNQLNNLVKKPKLVVTDSQVFKQANEIVPKDIKLTSFSILMARQKGHLEELVAGANAIDSLKEGDSVLIAEACTHVCQAEDIGRVKIPKWLEKHVGGKLNFEWYTGNSFPEDVGKYKLVVHCGACMINRRAMLYRQNVCKEAKVPMVNYGVAIAKLHGILDRVLSPFK